MTGEGIMGDTGCGRKGNLRSEVLIGVVGKIIVKGREFGVFDGCGV